MECHVCKEDVGQGAIREQVVTKAHCLFDKYLLNTYSVPEIFLDARGMAKNKIDFEKSNPFRANNLAEVIF